MKQHMVYCNKDKRDDLRFVTGHYFCTCLRNDATIEKISHVEGKLLSHLVMETALL
jgi:hypothetical protein